MCVCMYVRVHICVYLCLSLLLLKLQLSVCDEYKINIYLYRYMMLKTNEWNGSKSPTDKEHFRDRESRKINPAICSIPPIKNINCFLSSDPEVGRSKVNIRLRRMNE